MLSSSDTAVGGVAVFSRWPVEAMDREEIVHEDAACRVVVLKVFKPHSAPFIVYCIYLHSSDAGAAVSLGEAVLQHAASRTEEKIIIGDWNRLPTQQPAARAIATGCWKMGEPDGQEVDISIGTREDGLSFVEHWV